MNKCVLIGRLTKDPELKFTTGSGKAVANFTLAVDNPFNKDEQGNKKADFLNIVAWNKTAELVANYTHKGSQLAVCGRIQTRSYDANDGTKKYVTEIMADEVQFLDKKEGNTNSNNNTVQQNSNSNNQTQEQYIDDLDIPF